jgi:hypothetical protein
VILASFLASFFDSGDNGFDVTDFAGIIGALLALAGLWAVISTATRKIDSWRDRRHRLDVKAIMAPELEAQTATLMTALTEATKPIQPTTNGGLSLPDAHVTLNRIEGRLDLIERHQTNASDERAEILRVGAVNAKTITDAMTALGAEIELLPFDKPDDHH